MDSGIALGPLAMSAVVAGILAAWRPPRNAGSEVGRLATVCLVFVVAWMAVGLRGTITDAGGALTFHLLSSVLLAIFGVIPLVLSYGLVRRWRRSREAQRGAEEGSADRSRDRDEG